MSETDRDRDQLGPVTVSAREIYDVVIGVRDDVRSLRQSRDVVDETQGDHEERIRRLERWALALPVTFLGTVGALYLAATKGA
ncbi:hypothetical protein AB0J38_17330 [Streptomyces sp. NPDC050095]|uniref:hypothetical protein n=1 Tax=unclassified Streptomyces TaxID=2593676 RepID=UPI00341AA36D